MNATENENDIENGNDSANQNENGRHDDDVETIDDELAAELNAFEVRQIIMYLITEHSRNKRRFKVGSDVKFDELRELIKAKLNLKTVSSIVCDDENLVILDDEDVAYLFERAEKHSTALRINYESDIDADLEPMSPEKRKKAPDHAVGAEFEREPESKNDEIVDQLNLMSIKENEVLLDDMRRKEDEYEIAQNRASLSLHSQIRHGSNTDIDSTIRRSAEENVHHEEQEQEFKDDGNEHRAAAIPLIRSGFNFEPLSRRDINRPISSNDQARSVESSMIAHSDHVMYKKALQFADDLVFKGKDSKLNIYAFKRRLCFHAQIHEIRAKDLYKSLMNGTLIKDDAQEVLQLNVKDINPEFGRPEADSVKVIDYAVMVRRIWKILIFHYGHKDRVVEYMERIKMFKQPASMTTIQFIAKFRTYRNELELELATRNEEKQVHVGLTTYQYAQIFLANLRAEAMDYILRETVRRKPDGDDMGLQIDLEAALSIAAEYGRIEQMKSNALSYTARAGRKQSVLMVQQQRDQEEKQEEMNINQIRSNDSSGNGKRYCFSGKKSKCRKQQCSFDHFPEGTEDRVVRMYLDRFSSKDCRRRDFCKNTICPFRHSLQRRKSLGICKFDGQCTRKNCIFYHKQQVDRNGAEQQRINMVAADKENENDESHAILMVDTQKVEHVWQVEKVYEDGVQQQFVFDDRKASLADIEYNVSSKQEAPKLEKIIKAYFVYGTKHRLRGFIDSGADCSVAGGSIFEQFPDFVVSNRLKAVTLVPAGAATKYRSNERILVPVGYQDFDLALGKWVTKKRTLEIWKFDELPPEMILLGRDSMRTLGLNVYDRAALKYALYTKLRDIGCNTLLENEETNALFDRLQSFGGINSGVYVVNERKNTVQALEELQDANQIQVVSRVTPTIRKNEYDVHFIQADEEHEILQIDFDRLKPKILDESKVDRQNEYNDIIRVLRNNDRLIKDPEALFSKIKFGEAMGEELIQATKREIVAKNLLEVFTAFDWDLSVVECDDFVLKIKDEAKCSILDPYDLTAADTKLLNKEINKWLDSKSMHMLKQGEIMVHCSPAFIVHRYLGHTADGKRILKSRGAVDFVKLNANSYRYTNEYDKTIEEVQSKLSDYKYFNRSDISKYFYCIPVAAESKKYGGIVWYDEDKRKKYGIMDCVMHGLMDAPIYGQEITARAFEGSDCITVQDDIFGGAKTVEQAAHAFIRILEKAAKHKFRLNPGKTECCMEIIEAVGYYVRSTGIVPMPRNCTKALCFDVALIEDFKALRSWCGALNFLNGYVPKLALRLKKLKALVFDEKDFTAINKVKVEPNLKTKLRESIKPKFGDEAKEIVQEINSYIKAIPLLHHIDRSQTAGPIVVKVDTSLYGVGASLWQRRGTELVLCRLFSKALTLTESRYGATEREAIGFVKMVERFHKILVRRHFFAILDHKALLQLFGVDARKTKNYKLVRMRWRLAEYQFTMVHINGNSLGIAIEDYLSRYSKDAILASQAKDDGIKIDLEAIPDKQEINALHGKQIEMLEMHGYKIPKSENVEFDVNQLENGRYSVAEIEAIVDVDQTECLYVKRGTKPVEQKLNMVSSRAIDFKSGCDYTNLLKNERLTDPLGLNPNVMCYQQTNDVAKQLNVQEIGEILLLQQVAEKAKSAAAPLTDTEVAEMQKDIAAETKRDIFAVETRAMIKRRESADIQQREQRMKFTPRKNYLFEQNEDIFGLEANPLRVLYDTQRAEFHALCKYLSDGEEYHLDEVSLNEVAYADMARNGDIDVNDEGLLVYKDRYLIPSKVRVPLMHYYHNTATQQHRGERVMVETFKHRFYWIGMNMDIRVYVSQCPCRAAKIPKKAESGFDDKGAMTVYYATEPNQILFLDLYGALPDGNYVASIIDGFDSYLVSTALRPIYDITALGIIKFVMFEWLWTFGIPKKIVTDNGSNLVSRLNKLFAMIFGIKTTKIFEYSPWVNGKVENTMKNINQAVYIEKARREIIGLKTVRENIAKAVKAKDYALLIKTAALVNNNTVKETTGFEPRKLRFLSTTNIMLDVKLRLGSLTALKKEKYLFDGIVNYAEFFRLLNEHRLFLEKTAKMRKLKSLNTKAASKQIEGIKSETLAVGEYVIYRAPYKSKKEPSMKYGWIIIDRKRVGDKTAYTLRNIFDGKQVQTNKGHITRFHRPLMDPEKLYTNELTRLLDVDAEQESK